MTLDALEALLTKANGDFDVLFGTDEPEDMLKKYQALCHPDRYVDDAKKQAKADALRRRFDEIWNRRTRPVTQVKLGKRVFDLRGPFATGDISDLYNGSV